MVYIYHRFRQRLADRHVLFLGFSMLDSDSGFAGKDSSVVQRSELTVTTGGHDSARYADFKFMTCVFRDSWKLQQLVWQGVKYEVMNSKRVFGL